MKYENYVTFEFVFSTYKMKNYSTPRDIGLKWVEFLVCLTFRCLLNSEHELLSSVLLILLLRVVRLVEKSVLLAKIVF